MNFLSSRRFPTDTDFVFLSAAVTYVTSSIKAVEFSNNAWDNLIVEFDSDTIMSAVKSHFEKDGISIGDTLRGLLVYLYGPPGVGKSYTARKFTKLKATCVSQTTLTELSG